MNEDRLRLRAADPQHPEEFEVRTRVHGAGAPNDLRVPETPSSEGHRCTITREEFYARGYGYMPGDGTTVLIPKEEAA